LDPFSGPFFYLHAPFKSASGIADYLRSTLRLHFGLRK